MAFSGALTLTDLNDFITPSQACIKPVEQANPLKEKESGAASTDILIDSSGSYYEVSQDGPKSVNGSGRKLEQAQISLNDCLACSGCITSAESVLITLQSHTEVLNFLASNPESSSPSHKTTVMSISPQSLASLAASLSSTSTSPINCRQVLRRIEAFATQALGFEYIFDTSFARHIALLEHAREFTERKAEPERGGSLPMLASACPGWICYAEKAHSEMLPFISRTKSPQQVMGTLVKSWMGGKWAKTPNQIYHVSVMPCYDKKLEASRQDFYNEAYSTRDVDCVITTGELEHMMRDKGWNLSISVDGETSSLPSLPSAYHHTRDCHPDISIPELVSHPGTSSGSYLHSLISTVTLVSTTPLDLFVRTIRSADYEEYTLRERESGEAVFRGAKCYGFRNLQNVVRKVGRESGVAVGKGAAGRMGGVMRARRGRTGAAGEEKGYDYVEVMACPGGCVNGGGQLKPPVKTEDAEGYTRKWEESGVMEAGSAEGVLQNAKWGDKEWTKKVESAYWHDLPTPPASPVLGSSETAAEKADELARRILVDLCQPIGNTARWAASMDEKAEAQRRMFFRTQYRTVESEVVGLAVKW